MINAVRQYTELQHIRHLEQRIAQLHYELALAQRKPQVQAIGPLIPHGVNVYPHTIITADTSGWDKPLYPIPTD